MSWTCLLVDDEPYIRLILRKVIEQTEGFRVVAECGSMTEALLAFSDSKPDIVFMDVDLNGNSGIDCAKVLLKQNPDLLLIFATAYAEYMPDAFELYAFDYLVKPFDLERIRHTLERIRRQKEREESSRQGKGVAGETSEVISSSVPLPSETLEEEQEEAPKRLMLKKKDGIELVDIDDIILVAHEKTMTRIYTENKVFETSRPLTELESKLPKPDFLRCHRSYVIRVSRIRAIEPYGRWTYRILFNGISADALMTKENFDRLKESYD